jgi:sulfur carrier protein ThiS
MHIEVRLLLTFKELSPNGEDPFTLEFPPGVTVAQALESLGIPVEKRKVLVLNGRMTNNLQMLKDGDQLTVFPPLEGG